MEKVLRGLAASKGVFEGKVKIVNAVNDFKKVNPGDVLVVRSSSPAWTVPMLQSGALISQIGGIICHTAIVAREIGIPCVVGVPNILDEVEDNDMVRVNGETGEVYVLR